MTDRNNSRVLFSRRSVTIFSCVCDCFRLLLRLETSTSGSTAGSKFSSFKVLGLINMLQQLSFWKYNYVWHHMATQPTMDIVKWKFVAILLVFFDILAEFRSLSWRHDLTLSLLSNAIFTDVVAPVTRGWKLSDRTLRFSFHCKLGYFASAAC